jgi:Phytanoyl-CoA dioxygenase (PhyH)
MLTDEQRRAFHEDGFVALPGAVAPEPVARMRERIWRRLERNGAVRADPSTWRPHHANGLRPISRADPDPHESPIVAAGLDDLFGPGAWRTPTNWGQVLVTFPTPGPWDVPHRPWHLDHTYQPRTSLSGVNVFLFVDDVEPRGGGTVVVRGSPVHVGRFVERARPAKRTQKQWRTAFDASHPWFRALSDPSDTQDRVRRFLEVTDIDGVPTQLVELTGAAGDAVLCHPWLIHNGAPNVLDRPRLMRASRAFHHETLAGFGQESA